MDLKDLLTYELGPLPWSLVSCDGSVATTNKSIFSKELENGVECFQGFGIFAGNYLFVVLIDLESVIYPYPPPSETVNFLTWARVIWKVTGGLLKCRQ